MKKKIVKLESRVFFSLHNEVIKTFTAKTGIKADEYPTAQLYGYDVKHVKLVKDNKDISDQPSIYSELHRYAKNENLNPHYLYKKFREYENGKRFIKLNAFYLGILLEYIGVDSWDSFVEALPEALKKAQTNPVRRNKIDISLNEDDYTVYHCMYYSKTRHYVGHYDLYVDFDEDMRSNVKPNSRKFKAQAVHKDQSDQIVKIQDGFLNWHNNNIWLDLEENKDPDKRVTIIGVTGYQSPQTRKLILGNYLTPSRASAIVSGELIMINKSQYKGKEDEFEQEKEHAQKRFFMNLSQIKAPTSCPDDMAEYFKLEYRRYLELDKLRGAFTLIHEYGLNKEGKTRYCIGSMDIHTTYKNLISLPSFQNDLISFLQVAGEAYYIPLHREGDYKIMGLLIIEFDLEEQGFFKGIFSGTNRRGGIPISGACWIRQQRNSDKAGVYQLSELIQDDQNMIQGISE